MASLRKRCRHSQGERERCGCAWYADYRDDDGVRHQVNVGTDRREAQRQLRVLVGSGKAAVASRGFSDVADAFVASAANRCRPQTIRSYEAKVEHAKAYFGDAPVQRIDGPMLYQYGEDLLRSPVLSPRYARDLRTFAVMVMKYAADIGVIDSVPYVPKMRLGQDAELEVGIPDFDEAMDIIERMPADFRPGMQVLIHTGMRIGELLALQPEDVDLDAGTISITKTVQTKTGGVGPPKSRRGKRLIRLTSDDQMAAARGVDLPVPYSYNRVRTAWADHRTGDWTIHHLRHLNASMRIAQGQPITLVADQLGDTVETITKTYAHVIHEHEGVGAARQSP